jgi:uncharacterized protein YkwD
MARFLLFISSIIVSLFVFFSAKEAFFGAHTIPDTAVVQGIVQNASTSAVQTASRKSGTTTPPKKIDPVIPVSAKKIEPIAPKNTAPKVAAPLVHYTAGKRAPNTLLSAEVIAWTNTYREENHLTALARNQQLDAAAIIKVHDMFDRQYFEHVSPSGKNSADLVTGVGYEYLWVGENLALGIFSSEKDLVDAWMASPGHRANILNSHFEEIGVGVEEGEYEGKHVWIAVQEFGKPSSSCPTPEVSVKHEIEQNRAKIAEFSAQANNLILEINSLKDGRDADAYNQKVSEYNALVAELNPLVQKTKSLIDVYNKEINEYNACIGT